MSEHNIELLSNKCGVYINKTHRFGLDALILAYFANVQKSDQVCDLCSGCGIIPLIISSKTNGMIYGVEIDSDAINLFRSSISMNGLNQKVMPILADIKNISPTISSESIDIITCNPPYYPIGSGKLNKSSKRRNLRHEAACTISDVFLAAHKLLKFGGRICICHKPERLCDLLTKMRETGLEPKVIRFISQDKNKPPWLVLIEGRKGGAPSLKVLPNLYISDKDEMDKIYRGC